MTAPGAILQGSVSFDDLQLRESAETFHIDAVGQAEAPPPQSSELAPRLGVNIHLLQDVHSLDLRFTPPASNLCEWICCGRMSKGAAAIASLLTIDYCARWKLGEWALSGFSIMDTRITEASLLECHRM